MANKANKRGPGRPRAEITIPNRKFTFADLCMANGVNVETGKGKITKLTLRKFLKRDYAKGGKSEVVRLRNENREPASKEGLGRKTYVYIRRTRLSALKAVRKVSVNIGTAHKPSAATAAYEAKKTALLAPEPATAVPATPAVAEPVAS